MAPARAGLRALALEARFMFDAAAVATAADVLAAQAAAQQADAAIADAARQAPPPPPAAAFADGSGFEAAHDTGPHMDAWAGPTTELNGPGGTALADALAALHPAQDNTGTQIVFIDRSVEDPGVLLCGIDPRAEVVFIDGGSDGLAQVADALRGRSDVDAIHVISHGDPGELHLGNATYDSAALAARSADLAVIGAALDADGDILLYGCDTAAGTLGEAFTGNLARLTGADVAASTDATGAERLGGNWQLEYQVGTIESAAIVDERAQALYEHTLDAAVNTGNGAVLGVYGRDIVSIDVTTGRATVLTSVPTSVGGVAVGGTVNALSINAAAGLIYYFDGASTSSRAMFAYDFVNNTHILIDNDITDAGSVVVAGNQGVSGGGAAFSNGAMYLGVENVTGTGGADRIYRLNFSADGRTVTGTSVFVSAVSGGADWGDLAVDVANNALISTGSNDGGTRSLVRYDLTSGAQLTNTTYASTSIQLSAGTNGGIYALGGTTIQNINPLTGAVVSTVNVTTNGSTAISGTVADGAGAVPATGSIGDRIFDDNNGDGAFGVGDTGIANVTVQLVDDVNGNGVADLGERVLATDTTGAGGNYLFTGVLPGAYVVRVTDTGGVLGGSAPTNGAVTRAVSLATIGASNLAIDFAYDKVPPVVDLNSGTTTNDIVTNGGFTGGITGWTSTGSTIYANNVVRWDNDSISGTLTQANLSGLQNGPGTNGAAQIVFGFGWNNPLIDSEVPTTFTVSVGGVVYATVTTGRSNVGPNIATVAYSNGATGSPTVIASSTFGAWSYTDITINLPNTVADTGALVFGFSPPNILLVSGDDVSIDNVRVLTYTDTTAGRDWNATFTEDGAAVSIANPNSSVIDSDSTNMTSAQIVLTNGQAGDLLRIGGVALANGSTGTLNGLSYTVTVSGGVTTIALSGAATKAVYADTIEAITFESTLQNPLASPVRDITVTVSDGGFTSNTAHSYITVVPVNDAPVVATGSTLAYTENGAATAINTAITVSDVDNATLASATVAITGGFAAGQDVLGFTNVPATMGNITAAYNAATGVLTLSSAGNTATVAQWQAALRAVQYSNTSDNPSTAARTVSYTVNDGAAASNTVTSTVTVTAVNDAPTLATGSSITYTENGAATAINTAITVADLDNATLASATVAITGNFVPGQDVLSFTNVPATMGNIAGTYNAATGVITLSSAGGTATLAQWQAALRAVQYSNSSEAPSAAARTVTYTVNDGSAASNGIASTVNVTPVNDAPVNTLPANFSGTEDTAVGLTGLQVSDVDAGSSTVRVTLSVPTGTLTAATGGGVTVTGSGTATLVLEGSVASLNAYLASASRPNYLPVANATASVTLTMLTSDLGNTGSGGALTDSDTSTISFTAVNDAPAGADRTVTLAEDAVYTFSAADFPITDPLDTPPNTLQAVIVTTLPPASQGVLRLNGVAVVAGQRIAVGSLAQLTFTPTANLNGNGIGSFTFQVVDNGGTANGGVDTDASPNTFAFNLTPVNDVPVAVADTGTGAEDTPITGNVLANDTDIDGDTLTVTQFVVNGSTFTAGQTATIAGVGTLVVNANGSYTFTPALNYNGAPPVATYTVSDGAATATSTLTLTVTPVNDAPVNTLPASFSGTEDTAVGLTGLQVADVDAGSSTVRVTLSVPTGTLTAATGGGVTVTGSGTATLVLEGSVASLNAYLASASRPNYLPVANATASVTLTMLTSDLGNTGSGGALTDSDTATISFTAVNDAPAGADRTVTLAEDAVYTFSAADFPITDPLDTPPNTLQAVIVTTLPPASQGVLRLNGVAVVAGQRIAVGSLAQLTFTPTANLNGNGIGSFTFQVVDNGGTANGGVDTDASPNTFAFNLTPVNDVPVAVADTGTGAEDTPITGNVLANDTDIDGDTLTVTQFVVNGSTFTAGQTATIAGVGTLVVNANGSYTFTPALNYNGAPPVATYTVSDGAATSTSTLTLTVTPVNDAPVAVADTNTTLEDTPVSGNVLANDTDVDSVSLNVTQFVVGGTTYTAGQTATLAGVGTLTIAANGAYTFTPALDYNGPVPVATYTVSDGALTATSTLTLTVTPVNDPPVAAADTVVATEDTPLTIAPATLLGNDSDVDGNTLTITSVQGAVNGSVSLVGGNVVFTPAANFNGTASFSYTIGDGNGGTATATVTVSVAAVNDAPVANNDVATTAINTPLANIPVLANDVDVDGDTLTVISATVNPALGTVTVNPNGTLDFTPATNVTGAVAISYTISDGTLTSTATLTVNVGTNTPPQGADGVVAGVEDTPVALAAANFGFSDADPGQTLANVRIDTLPAAGTLLLDGVAVTAGQVVSAADIVAGRLSFVPGANGNGIGYASFTFSVQDSAGAFDTTPNTLAFDIAAVNDPPVLVADTATIAEDTTATGNVLGNDTDVDSALTVTQFVVGGTTYTAGQTATLAGVGALVINANGSYTFTPAANYNGPVPVATYTVSDGVVTASSTLTINVTPVDDPFTDADEVVATNEDTPLSGSVLTGTTSPDGPVTVTSFQVAGNATVFTAGQTATIAGIGTLLINTDGSYTFTPAANYNGPVPVVTYTMTDGSSGDTSTLTLSVTPVDDPFTDADEVVVTNEDTPLSGSVLTGTTSVDGPVTVTSFQVAGNATVFTAGQTATIAGIGTLLINADGSYTFTPAANYNGPVPVVTYTMTDGSSGDTSTLAISVTPVDDPFFDANEVVSTNEDTPLSGSVLTGTTSPDGPVTVTSFQVAGNAAVFTAGQTASIAGIGTLLINADGSYTFTPAANYNGPVPVVTYTMTDGSSGDTSTLTISVTPVDDPFTDADEVVVTVEDTPLSGSVLTGTTSVDGPVTVTSFQVAGNATVFTAGQTATIAGIGTLLINADGSYTFTPAANYNGPVPVVTYTMTDGSSGDTSTLTITVSPVDDPFSDADEIVSTNEDTPLSGSVLTGTTSPDGPVTVTSFTVAGNPTTFTAGQVATIANVGTLVINADGSYTFTPAANYNGPVPAVTYSMTDGSSGDTSTLTISVAPVDDPFTDADEVVATNEDTPLSGSVLTGTTSPDGPVTVTSFQVAGNATVFTAGQTASIAGIGTLLINADGSYTFTPAANYNGPVPVVTYTMTDGSSGDTSTLTLSVTPVDDPFTDADEVVVTNEDTPLSGSVLTGTSSVDGPVTVTSFQVAGNATVFTAGQTATIAGIGTLLINADGSYTFTPAANYNGPVPVVTYTMTDGSSGDTSTLAISVTPVDDPFFDANEVVSTNEDTPLSGSVLTGTTSPDGPITVTSFQVAGNAAVFTAGQTATIAGIGTLLINADGSYTFTPAANYNGPVPVVTYTMTDGSSGDTSTLTITVAGVNDAPVGNADANSGPEDTVLAGNVLANDTDIDNDALTVTQFVVDGITYTAGQTAAIANVGALTINADGSYVFTPAANFSGAVPTATYTLSDGGATAISTLNLSLAAVNDAPVNTLPATYTTNEDATIGLTGLQIADPDAGNGTMRVTLSVAAGTLTAVAGNGVTVTGSGSGTLILEGSLASINAYLASAARPNYVPTPNDNGNIALTMATSDLGNTGSGGPLTDVDGSTIIIVASVNDAPEGSDNTIVIDEDAVYTFSAADFPFTDPNDVPANALQSVIVTTLPPASQGVLRLNGVAVVTGQNIAAGSLGQLTFTPAANLNGTGAASFTFQVVDNGGTALGGQNTDATPNTIRFNINPVNDAPVAGNDVAATAINTPLANIAVLANDSDADGDALVVTAASVNPALGTVSINPNGTLNFTPALDVTGPVQVSYTVSDGRGGTANAVLTVNVGTNTPPQGADAVAAGVEDTPLVLSLAAFPFSDADAGQTLANVRIDTLPTGGTLLFNGTPMVAGQVVSAADIAAGRLSFVPGADGNGTGYASLTFSVQDSGGAFDTTPNTLRFDIAAVNDAPVANADVGTLAEDTSITGNVLTNDVDADADTLAVTQFTIAGTTYTAGQSAAIANVGTLTVNADGSYVFTPVANFNGSVPVATYTATDGTASASATLTLTVTPVDDAFTDADESVSTNEDTPLAGTVLAGTSSVDGPVTVTGFSVAGNGTYAAGQTATIVGAGTLTINADGSYAFVPAANFNGAVPLVTYTLTDGSSGDTSTLAITVTPVNDAPVNTLPSSYATNEDTSVSLTGLSVADVDAAGGTITVTLSVGSGTLTATAGGNVAVSGSGTGTLVLSGSLGDIDAFLGATAPVYAPAANASGNVTLTMSTNDGGNTGGAPLLDVDTTTIVIAPVNDAPTAVADAVTANEDTPATGNVLANDSDIDGDALAVTQFSIGGNSFAAGQLATLANVGTLVVNADGSYVFTPAANYNGPVPVATYTVSDGNATATASLTITLTPVDDAFADADESASTAEDTPLSGSVLTGTASVDGPVTVTGFQVAGDATAYGAGQTAAIAGVGTLVINADGSYTFTPAANYNGPVPLVTYTMTDGSSGDSSTLAITVTPVEDAPVAGPDTLATNEDTPLTIAPATLLANDGDVDGDPLTIVSVQGAVNGSVALVGGNVVFTPAANFNGPASFTYTISDGAGGTATATVTVNVAAVNDAPVANNDVASTTINTPLANIAVLANDTDVDGPPLTVVAASVNPALGVVSINPDGTLNFTPATNVTGPVAISYTASDGTLTSTATLTVNVGNNTPPQGTDANVAGVEDTPLALAAANFGFTDADAGQTLASVRIDTLPAAGTLQLNGVAVVAGQVVSAADIAAGRLSFVPAANGNGAGYASFTFSVQDSGGAFDTAPNTLTFDIAAVNDTPVAVADTLVVTEDVPATGNVLANDSDPDNDALAVTQFSVGGVTYTAGQTATLAGIGALVINADGSYTFTPAANYNGPVPVVSYTVSDGSGTANATASATLTLSVAPVDDPFTDADEVVSATEDVVLTGSVLTGTTSPDGPVTVTSFQVAGNAAVFTAGQTATIAGIGTLLINADGSYTFAPAANYNGPVPVVTYTMTDGSSGDTSTLTLSVTPVDDPFTDADEVVVTNEDTPLSGSVLTGTSSVDGPVTVTSFQVAGNAAVFTAGQTATIANVGALLLNADGSYSFTPVANFNGAVPVVTYTMTDGSSGDTSTLTITVTGVNDAPVANADTGAATEDTPLSGNVLANDTDIDGDTLTVTTFGIAGDGTVYAAGQTATIAGIGSFMLGSTGGWTFTPAANYFGPVPVVSYTATDGSALTASTLTITVAPVNDPPVNTIPSTYLTNEDTPVSLTGLQVSDVDANGGTIRVTLSAPTGAFTATSGAGVAVSGSGTGAIVLEGTLADINAFLASGARPSYVPVNDASGSVTLTMTTSDLGNTGSGGVLVDVDAATIIIVASVNDAPSGADRTVVLAEDGTYTFSAADFPITDANDSPPHVLESVIVTTLPPAGQGVLRFNGVAVVEGQVIPAGSLGLLTFTPAANLNGAGLGAFSFQVVDNGGTANGGQNTDPTPKVFRFDITAVNDAPVAGPDTVAAVEDTPLTIAPAALLGNDTDADGNALSIVSVQGAVNGSVALVGGNVVFTPAANFNGPASFTYTVSDGNGGTSTATVTVNVAAVNDAPVAVDDVASTTINTPLANIAVLANDIDVDGPPLTVVAASVNPALGTVTINPNGTLNFVPAPNVVGPVLISYTASDGSLTSTATLTVNVGNNTAPQGADSVVAGVEDTPLVLAVANFGFTDADAGQSLANVRIDTLPATGTLQLNGAAVVAGQVVSAADIAAGRLVFVPAANGNGAGYASFTFSVQDSGGAFDTAPNTLSFDIAAVNDAPVASADTVAATEDTPLTITPATLLGNDSDVDGNPLTITSVQGAVNGSVALVGGNVVFTPAPNFNGPASFTYTVSDGNGGTATATVTVNVAAVVDPPTANPDSQVIVQGTSATGNVLANDVDVDGNPLTVLQFSYGGTTYAAGQTASIANVGTLTIGANGAYVFAPVASYFGPMPAASYVVSDGNGVASTSLSITVTRTNTAPVAGNDVASTPINTPLGNIVVLANDSDAEGDPLTVTAASVNPALGTVGINPDGSLNFTPAPNVSGPVQVSYTVSDGRGGTATAVLTVDVGPNTAPQGGDATVAGVEDLPVVLTLADFPFSDADAGQALANVRIDTLPAAGRLFYNGTPVVAGQVISAVDIASGRLSFVPGADGNGAGYASFAFSVQDSSGVFDTTPNTLRFDLAAVNDPPVASSPPASTVQDQPVAGQIAATDVDGTVFVYAVQQGPMHGTLTVDAQGRYVYTPLPGYVGLDGFTVSVSDGQGGIALVSVPVSIALPTLPGLPPPSPLPPPGVASDGTDVSQLIAMGQPTWPAGREVAGDWGYQHDGRQGMAVPLYIDEAVNRVRSLNGTPFLDGTAPVLRTVNGIRSLDGIAPIGSGTPILDLVENLRDRYRLLDPVQALFEQQGDPNVTEATQGGSDVVVGDIQPDGPGADAMPPPGGPRAGGPAPAAPPEPRTVGELLFSEQIELHAHGPSDDTELLAAALRAGLPHRPAP